MQKQMKIRLVHSQCGRKPKQRATVKGLGLTHLYSEREIADTPENRGMVNKVPHLVRVVGEGEGK